MLGSEPLLRPFVLDRKAVSLKWICAASNETNAETGIAQALFNGQRMEKQEPSSQINFFYNILHLKSRYLENNVSALKNECLEMVKYIYLVGEKYICMSGNSITIYFVNIFILSPNIKFIYWCVIPYSRYSCYKVKMIDRI